MANHVFIDLNLYTVELSCRSRCGLEPLDLVNGNLNATAHKDILDNGLLPTFVAIH